MNYKNVGHVKTYLLPIKLPNTYSKNLTIYYHLLTINKIIKWLDVAQESTQVISDNKRL